MSKSLLGCVLVLSLPLAAVAQSLAVGDAAPALAIGKWVKGEPVAAFAKDHIYVVEFWATWCGPCIASMPHLTEIQHRYGDKGVTVIGVSTEDPNNSLAAVEAMVAQKGDTMGYTVAWDDAHKTSDAFMRAAGRNGIPCAFVVDRGGKLAYIGHPMLLELPLDGLLAGDWDAHAGQAKAERAMKAFGQLSAVLAKDDDESRAKVEAFQKDYPMLAALVESSRFLALVRDKQFARAVALAAPLVDKAIAQKDASLLNEIAWAIVDPQNAIEKRDLGLAQRAAEKAVECSGRKDANILDTLARVWFWKRDYQKAVEVQREAVALGKNEELAKTLAEYEKLQQGGSKGQ